MGKKLFEKSKDYKFEAKLYPDCRDYDCECVLAELLCIFSEYAYILHDKDLRRFALKDHPTVLQKKALQAVPFKRLLRGKAQLVKPHIHFYGKNNHNRQFSLEQLIQRLEIPYKYAHNGDFAYISSWDACMAYTVHANAPEKYQYSPLEVKTNIPSFAARYLRYRVDLNGELALVLQHIDEFYRLNDRPITFWELVIWCNENELRVHIQKSLLLKDCLYSFRYPQRI